MTMNGRRSRYRSRKEEGKRKELTTELSVVKEGKMGGWRGVKTRGE